MIGIFLFAESTISAEHYSKHLQKNKISLKSFVQKVIESALASEYRCGIILDYEVDYFELLRNIA